MVDRANRAAFPSATRLITITVMLLGILQSALYLMRGDSESIPRVLKATSSVPEPHSFYYIHEAKLQPSAPAFQLASISRCIHLNYEQLDLNKLPKILRALLPYTGGCAVVYWQNHSTDAIREALYTLLSSGYSQIVWRLDLKMPSRMIEKCKYEDLGDLTGQARDWVNMKSGLPPAMGSSKMLSYQERKSDAWRSTIAGFLYDVPWAYEPLSQAFTEYNIAIQVFNEPNLQVEWQDESPPPEYQSPYWLGHVTCSLSLLFAASIQRNQCSVLFNAGQDCGKTMNTEDYFQFVPEALRVPIVIPDLAQPADRGAYIRGCFDALSKVHASLVQGAPPTADRYILLRGANLVYGAHIYVDCSRPLEEQLREVKRQVDEIQGLISQAHFVALPQPVPLFVTEFGCAQLGTTATRQQQATLYNAVQKLYPTTPFAWWVGTGRRCYPADSPTTGRNTPEDWDRMALVNEDGLPCTEEVGER